MAVSLIEWVHGSPSGCSEGPSPGGEDSSGPLRGHRGHVLGTTSTHVVYTHLQCTHHTYMQTYRHTVHGHIHT